MVNNLKPYKILGVSPNSSMEEIRDNYKKLIKKLHPDQNSNLTEDDMKRFRLVQKAFKYLKINHVDIESSSVSFVDDNSSNYSQNNRIPKHLYVVCEIPISLAFSGGEHNFEVPFVVYCEHCGGSGKENDQDATNICYDCAGKGEVLSSYGIMRVKDKCKSCSGTGKSSIRSCVTCHGVGTLKSKRELSINIPPNSKFGDQIYIEDFLDEVDDIKKDITAILHCVNDDCYNFDSNFNINSSLNTNSLEMIIGLKKNIKDPYGNIIKLSFSETKKINNKFFIEKPNYSLVNGVDKKLVINLNILPLKNLSPEAVSELKNFYLKYLK